MSVEIAERSTSALAEYARLAIAFEVREILHVRAPQQGLGGLTLHAEPVDVPYWKDYDADPSSHPTRWTSMFDTTSWAVLVASQHGSPVGGAVVAWNSPGLDMLEGRQDLAVLWDLRVVPESRRHGIGVALFRAAEAWAVARGVRRLKVETQNVNVPACRFYAGQGCTLGAIHRFAYPALPEEVQLLWYKDLAAGTGPGTGPGTSPATGASAR
jgi:ribosomal protein S18 acetylase RimI-like enzyme